jgi:hypothetical protein
VTLVELVVALAVLALMTGAAAMAFRRPAAHVTPPPQLGTLMRAAKAQALASGTTVSSAARVGSHHVEFAALPDGRMLVSGIRDGDSLRSADAWETRATPR